jgi:hypothetical protein
MADLPCQSDRLATREKHLAIKIRQTRPRPAKSPDSDGHGKPSTIHAKQRVEYWRVVTARNCPLNASQKLPVVMAVGCISTFPTGESLQETLAARVNGYVVRLSNGKSFSICAVRYGFKQALVDGSVR